jgi:hypothetical protein
VKSKSAHLIAVVILSASAVVAEIVPTTSVVAAGTGQVVAEERERGSSTCRAEWESIRTRVKKLRTQRRVNAFLIANLGWKINQTQMALSSYARFDLRLRFVGLDVFGTDDEGLPAVHMRSLKTNRFSDETYEVLLQGLDRQQANYYHKDLLDPRPSLDLISHIDNRLSRVREYFAGSERLGYKTWTVQETKKWTAFFEIWSPGVAQTWKGLVGQMRASRELNAPSDAWDWTSLRYFYSIIFGDRSNMLANSKLWGEVSSLRRLHQEQTRLQSLENRLRDRRIDYEGCGESIGNFKIVCEEPGWRDCDPEPTWYERYFLSVVDVRPLSSLYLVISPKNYSRQTRLHEMPWCEYNCEIRA